MPYIGQKKVCIGLEKVVVLEVSANVSVCALLFCLFNSEGSASSENSNLFNAV